MQLATMKTNNSDNGDNDDDSINCMSFDKIDEIADVVVTVTTVSSAADDDDDADADDDAIDDDDEETETKTKNNTKRNNTTDKPPPKKKVSYNSDIDDAAIATASASAAAEMSIITEDTSNSGSISALNSGGVLRSTRNMAAGGNNNNNNNTSNSYFGGNSYFNNSNSNNSNSNSQSSSLLASSFSNFTFSKREMKQNNNNGNNNGKANSSSSSNMKKNILPSSHSSSVQSVQNKATYDDDVMIKDLNEWVGLTKETSNSVTGVLLCSMIERVAKDGKFSEKEAKSVMTCLSCQQSLFGYLIVMDCLFLSMFLPLLVEDTLVWEGDNNGDGVEQHNDNDNGVASDISHSDISLLTWNIIKILYEINVSFVFFSCCVHVMICGLFLGLSSYLMDAKSVLWMLVHCHSNFVFINNTMFPIFVGVIMTGMLGTVLRLGVVRAIPAIIFATLAIVLSISYYNKIIRPLFFLLGTTGDGTWIANEEVDETLGRNTKKVLKKLLKSNNRNYSRSSMINVFDRIAAGSDGADGNANANANANGEGGLDIDALRNGIGKTSVMLTDYEMKALFQAVDKDGDGVITRDEWEEMVNEEADYNASKDFLVE